MSWIESLTYKSSDFELHIPRWDFPDQGISCVYGESGSGKTTLLQIMSGLLPSPHKLCVKGEFLSDMPVRVRNIGFVFQDFGLFPHMTALENIVYPAKAKGLIEMIWSEQRDRLVDGLGIKNILDQKASSLSGGEQQRVALARALITKPRIVLLDEPLSALDENRRDEARLLISKMAEEMAIPFILVTHDLRDVRRLSENILVLKNGEMLASGKTAEVLSRPPTLQVATLFSENQVLVLEPGKHMVGKYWDFRLDAGPQDLATLNGRVESSYGEGPFNICLVRLSSGQIIKAVAPLGHKIDGDVVVHYNPRDLTVF